MLRMFAFDGKIEFITVQSFDAPPLASYYLADWTPAPFKVGARRRHDQPRPANLAEALDVAIRLSQGFLFVRVDLYWLAGRIVFSELTFSPGNGLRPIRPRKADLALGRRFAWNHGRR